MIWVRLNGQRVGAQFDLRVVLLAPVNNFLTTPSQDTPH